MNDSAGIRFTEEKRNRLGSGIQTASLIWDGRATTHVDEWVEKTWSHRASGWDTNCRTLRKELEAQSPEAVAMRALETFRTCKVGIKGDP